jgi:hypothetical protein
VNKIKSTTLIVVFLGLTNLQGCSFLPFKNCNILTLYDCNFEADEQIIDTGKFSYHYQEPVRKPLSSARIKSLKLGHPKAIKSNKRSLPSSNQYYSANGNVCHTIDANGKEVACAVSGRWQTSPSVFLNYQRSQ